MFVVPEKYRQSGKKFKIIRIHDGVASVLDVDYDEESHVITFETDCLSTYALAYVVDKPTPSPTPEPDYNPSNPTNTSTDVTASETETVKVKAPKTKDSFPFDVEVITFICHYLTQMFYAQGHL